MLLFSEDTRKKLEDLHRMRFLFIDMDILFILLISVYISVYYNVDLVGMFLLMLILSILVHRIFRINTRVNEVLFGLV
jgi:Na+/citrate or Na+/malate symporter